MHCCHFKMLTVHSVPVYCRQNLFWSCSIPHVNCVCSGDKPINHSILMGPCYHLGDYCILLTLRDTISYPRLFTPSTPIQHIPLLLCSCKSDEGHASFCQRRAENERLAFIHNSEVCGDGWGVGGWKGVRWEWGWQGSLVRKEMSCYPVMTMLVREHL